MQPTLEQELRQLLDKQKILDLVNAYCNAADRHDHGKMRTLYHPDAIDDHGSFAKGLAQEFIDKLPEIQAPMEILQHHITTTNIKLGEPSADGEITYAEGEIYVLAFHKVKMESGSVDLLIGGRYFDKYEKRDGVWKYAYHAIVADWANYHNPSIVDLEHPMLQGSYFGKPGQVDPSYEFFSLLKWGER